MIKGLVFIDFDGTLINSKGIVSDEDVLSIIKLTNNHYKPILATGRSPFEVSKIMHKVKINCMVGMNGQIIIWENQVISNKVIKQSILHKITSYSNKNNVGISYYNSKRNAVSLLNELVECTYHNINSPIPPVDETIYTKEPVNMMLIATDSLDEEYRKLFPELTFVRNNPYCLDVFCKNNNKGKAIEKLIRMQGLSGLPIYVFGDGTNDQEMFQIADISIAMGNSVAELKEIASYVTSTNDENGITQGLKYYKLID